MTGAFAVFGSSMLRVLENNGFGFVKVVRTFRH